jgi:hypothetical protein
MINLKFHEQRSSKLFCANTLCANMLCAVGWHPLVARGEEAEEIKEHYLIKASTYPVSKENISV